MGIPIGGGRKRRRSYADYRPPSRHPRPRSDPFRVVFYLVLIGVVLWVYLNQESVKRQVGQRVAEIGSAVSESGGSGGSSGGGQGPIIVFPTATPRQSAEDLAAQGETAYHEGRMIDAIDFYRQAADLAPNNVEYHTQVARLLLFQSALEYGDQRDETLTQALDAANGAILADPFRPEGYAILGKVYDWQGDYERALSELQRALELNEDYAPAHSYMAEALVDLDRWEKALAEAQLAVNLAPDHADVRRDYAYVLESLGDYYNATTQYETAAQIHPNLPYLLMALGRNYRQIGRYQEAFDRFFAVETLDPGNAIIPFEIGFTYESFVGDVNSALEYYQRAVELDEQYPFPWARIGSIRYVQGSYEQAIPAFERALDLGLENLTIYYQLGRSYAFTDQCDEAVPYLMEALQRAEGDESLVEAIEEGLELCPEQVQRLTPVPTPTDTP